MVSHNPAFLLALVQILWGFMEGMGIQRNCTLRTTIQHTDTSTIYFVYNITLNMEYVENFFSIPTVLHTLFNSLLIIAVMSVALCS
jgi:hypothetical protein